MRLPSTPATRIAALALAAAGLATAGLAACAPDASRPTRVVLITLDTLRYDRLAADGEGSVMPQSAALARDGVAFTRFFATSSTTQPTHASLFTGVYPWAHGVTRNGVVLSDDERTIAEILNERGFETHAVVASFPLHEIFGFAQGFDTFEDDFDEPYALFWEGERTEGGKFFSLARSVTDSAIGALDAAQGERQFFWFHYFDPHDPYGDTAITHGAAAETRPVAIQQLFELAGGPASELERALEAARESYDRDLAALDRELGRLYRRLRADEERFDTHLVVTADHGESFGERLALGHGKRVTREQVQVPLILHSPRLEPAVRRDLASSVDLARTVLSLAGVEVDTLEGRDLSRPPRPGEGETIFGMRRTFADEKTETLTDGRERLLAEHWFFTVRGDDLYSGDETTVLAEDELDRVVTDERGTELARAFGVLGELLDAAEAGEEILDEDVQAGLRALGYTR